ncbi:carboxymuconolactone decarboxylase family protein [Pseudoalteromonas spongiae]|uniref:carboxymuconolactone decarboxylase family protein n=1 Tax=Pseudoalteromonas spongiae TaxID=298657 RepID=UPI00110B20F2|nr:carboxymuconolactone decarboxylase family protein [Pseudoalteromonas spongiae]TMO88622.1 4-carboxymuconolactone decarboxylase [Pseudoalteromonas spongiae]
MLPIVDQVRHKIGLEKLQKMGPTAQTAIKKDLAGISPDMARYAIEATCGDIYSRPGLDPKYREMIAIAALTTLGFALPQLKIHVEAALEGGCTRSEIEEIIIQMSVYIGWPAAFNAMSAANEVFESRSS